MHPLERLTTAECWAMLGEHTVGRVAFTEQAQPMIVPVDYTLVGERVVLRCANETLAVKLDGQVVAFEVDDVDRAASVRRSVVLTGMATSFNEPGYAAVRLTIGQVRGRHLQPA